jgi:hypothetical protein
MSDTTSTGKTPAKKAAEAKPTESSDETAAEQGNTAVPHQGDHDRVGMLSVRADGTPDQHNPEIIGDKDAALAATTEQFQQQAVSAVDVQNAPKPAAATDADQDPTIAKAQAEHQKVAVEAADAAKAVVDGLHQG